MINIFEDPRLRDGTAPRWFQYIFNIGLGASQFINAILGGDPDESISSRTHRAAQTGHCWFVLQEKALDALMGKDHCKNAAEWMENQKEVWHWGNK